jgi:uracil-DNA glycosylase
VDSTAPGTLRNADEIDRRRELWDDDPTLATLRDYVASIERTGHRVPLIDPADAAADARVLLVLEAPGTMADAVKGSGFISVDNTDQTARNCWQARKDAGLVEGVLHWNIVPWYLGVATKKPTGLQLADGAIRLRYLIDLLPNLETVVLCGEYAKEGYRTYMSRLFHGNAPDVIETWHPSPSSLNFGNKRVEFTAALARAAARL